MKVSSKLYYILHLQKEFGELTDVMNSVKLYFRIKLLSIHIVCVDFSLSEEK